MNKIRKALGNVLGNLSETDENVLNKRGQRTTWKETMRIETTFQNRLEKFEKTLQG